MVIGQLKDVFVFLEASAISARARAGEPARREGSGGGILERGGLPGGKMICN